MATNLPFCFFIQYLEQLLKFLANITLLKYVKSQRSCGFFITKKFILGFQIVDLKVHFSAPLILQYHSSGESINKLKTELEFMEVPRHSKEQSNGVKYWTRDPASGMAFWELPDNLWLLILLSVKPFQTRPFQSFATPGGGRGRVAPRSGYQKSRLPSAD